MYWRYYRSQHFRRGMREATGNDDSGGKWSISQTFSSRASDEEIFAMVAAPFNSLVSLLFTLKKSNCLALC